MNPYHLQLKLPEPNFRKGVGITKIQVRSFAFLDLITFQVTPEELKSQVILLL